MPSLKDIRTRIKAVKSTQKITRAMKMVAAAKLRRAQSAAEGIRPYADRLKETIWEVSQLTDVSEHPLLEEREQENVMVLVLTSDRGLCGGFASSIIRTTESFVQENGDRFAEIGLGIGRKGNEHFGKRDYTVLKSYNDVLTNPSMERARQIGNELVALYTGSEMDAIYVVYNEFKNAATQEVVVERLLPVQPEETADTSEAGLDFVYEPSQEEVLEEVIPLHVSVEIYRAILESLASEMGARMTAMDSATKNAGDLIDRLTLQFNRARQAAITKELMEIVSGRGVERLRKTLIQSRKGNMSNEATQTANGFITQVIGPVVDVEFQGPLPEILTAITVTNPGIDDTEDNLVRSRTTRWRITVRAIAMDSTDGLVRGFEVRMPSTHSGSCRERNTGSYPECDWRAG